MSQNLSTSTRRLELCAELNAIAKGGLTPGYFARRAPLWAELAALGTPRPKLTQPRLFEVQK